MSAPLSTRKDRFRREQKTERAPWACGRAEEREEMVNVDPGVTADSRPWRFPEPKQQKEGGQSAEEEEFAQA